MIECDFCGCYSPKHEKGWVAYAEEDDIGFDAPGIVVYCPPCAVAALGYPLDAALEHVCVWKWQPQTDG